MTILALVYITLMACIVIGVITSAPNIWQGLTANIVIASVWIVGLALAVGALVSR